MHKGGDIIALGQLAEARDGARSSATLPVGIEVHQVADQPTVVARSITEFMRTLLEAVVIVLAVSFLSLGLRTGVVVALSIPLVLAMTFLGMLAVRHRPAAHLARRADHRARPAGGRCDHRGGDDGDQDGAGLGPLQGGELRLHLDRPSMLTGTLITAAGFLPVGLAKSAAGEYTFSIFAVVTMALLISWIVAVLFTPYLGYKLLPDLGPA